MRWFIDYTGRWGLGLAVLIHVILLEVLMDSERPALQPGSRPPPVTVRLIEKKSQAIELNAQEVEALKNKQAQLQKNIKKSLPQKKVVKKPKPPKNRPRQLQPKKKKNLKPRKYTISMDAVVGDSPGAVAVPVDTSDKAFAFGAQDGNANAAKKRIIYDAADPSAISSLPKLIGQASEAKMRRMYPEKARRQGREANVLLRILVDAKGGVEDVTLVKKAGFGFDAVALKLAKDFRFQPAMRDGKPVAVWIPWTYKFRLD